MALTVISSSPEEETADDEEGTPSAAAGEHDDVRSIEAEKVGDDEEALDADLEREFLLQQEAKDRRLRAVVAAAAQSIANARGDEEDDDDDVASPPGLLDMNDAAGAESPRRRAADYSAEAEEFRILGLRAASAAAASRRGRAAALRPGAGMLRTGIFVEGDGIARCAAANDDGVKRLILFPDLNVNSGEKGPAGEEGMDEVDDEAEDEGEEGNRWLRLGPATNFGKHGQQQQPQHSNASIFPCRKIVSGGSSSKVSVRTVTSLERQYSTGSTSTVESPHFVGSEISVGDRPPVRRRQSPAVAVVPGLTFSFPGWGVDISKGERHPSVVVSHHRHAENATEPPAKPLCESRRRKTVIQAEYLGDSSPVCSLPDEILVHVFRRLDILDLCSTIQTCRRWYEVGQQDHLWNQFLGDTDGGLLSDSSSEGLPRWLCKKNSCLLEGVRVRFNVFSKGYNYLRRALHEWWETGFSQSRYPSRGIYSLIRKLTGNDWPLLYEALGVTFTDRADRVAVLLLKRLKPPPAPSTGGPLSEPIPAGKGDSVTGGEGLSDPSENAKSVVYPTVRISEVQWKSGAVKEVSEAEGQLGKKLWACLLKFWERYRSWLLVISTHSPDLNHEVGLERGRSVRVAATPTLFDNGLICFRSQVLLKYGLRSVLQAGFMFLSAQHARDCTSEQDANLLRSAHHLLQELDVADDLTLPEKSRTQTKLRQCFRSALTTNSKLALHMNDKLNHL